MRKNTLNFIVDAVATVAMLVLIASGFLLYLVLVPGSHGGRGLQFWGMSRHEWGDIHFWSSIALIALVLLHVILHWDWVCLTVYRWISPEGFREKRLTPLKQTLIGIVFLLACTGLVGGFVWYASATVTRGADDHELHEGGGHGQGSGHGGGRGEGRRRGRHSQVESADPHYAAFQAENCFLIATERRPAG